MKPKTVALAVGLAFLGVMGSATSAVAQRSQVETAMLLVQAKLAKEVVDQAQSKLGTKVGGGDSTELVAAALAAAHAEPGKTKATPYTWGTPVAKQKGETRVKPRALYIIQMEGCVFKKPTGPDAYDVMEFKRHTAIIKSVSGTSVVLLHQGLNPKKSVVVETTLDFAWLTAGDYQLYAPIPAKPKCYIVCSPIDWTQVKTTSARTYASGSDEFVRSSVVRLLKQHGFETETRVVAGKLTLFARLLKETKTPYYGDGDFPQKAPDGRTLYGIGLVVLLNIDAIADLIYVGGHKANKSTHKVKRVDP